MGLKLSVTQPDGLVTEYWRIVKFYLDREHFFAQATLAPYKDQAFRIANGPSSYNEANAVNFQISGSNMPCTIEDYYAAIKLLPTSPETGNIPWVNAIDE